MFDYLTLYREELHALCGPGEQPLAILMATYMQGHEEITTVPARDGVSFDLDGVQVERWERGLEKVMGGHTLYAPRGGRALEVKHAADNSSVELLLTNRRLLVLESMPGKGEEARVVWACAIDDIATVRRTPRLLQAGRISLVFGDGSSIRLMAGMVLAKRARTFVDAFRQLTGR